MKQALLFEKLIHLVGEIQHNRINKTEFDLNESEKREKREKRGKHGKNDEHEKHEKHEKQSKHRKHKQKMSPVTRNILMLLLKDDNINQRTLAQNCKVSSQAISDSIKKLEERELIIKTQGEANNENLISLTESGREKAQHLEMKMQKLANGLFENFTQDELDNFTNLVEKLEKNHENFAKTTDEENI